MSILFICGSAEPGKDGVGDYTRRLACKLAKSGHEIQILSLCDQQADSFITEDQMAEGITVQVHRIPIAASNTKRFFWLQEILNDFEPDWISLQYVPYSFNPKGLPFWLPSYLKRIKGHHKWHIMFHELWLGIDIESSLKHKCIGRLQQFIVKQITQSTNTNLVNTQNKLYQFFLQANDINAQILPICSNIPVTAVKKEETGFTQFVLFGTIHNGAPFDEFVTDLKKNSNQFNKPVKIVFIGNNGPELNNYIQILEKYTIDFEVLGIQPENVISQVLLNSDFGISTTPYFQTEKSGVYAAYREHKINTICVSRKWTPTKGQYTIPQIIKYEKNKLKIVPMQVEVFDLHTMATKFINSISTL